MLEKLNSSTLEKFDLFHLRGLITPVLLIWKWTGLFLKKNNLLRDFLSLVNWIGILILSLLLKLLPRKMDPWLDPWSFFYLRLLFISINLPFGLAWNTVVMSGLVLLAATLICQINYRNRFVGLWPMISTT